MFARIIDGVCVGVNAKGFHNAVLADENDYVIECDGPVVGYNYDNESGEFSEICQSCAEILAAKKAEIRATCESKIDAGFVCSALFPDANYRNSEKQNLTMMKACKAGGRIWVNEAFKFHTAEQAEEVYDFANSEIERLRLINANKQAYLDDTNRTEEEATAVTWDSVEKTE